MSDINANIVVEQTNLNITPTNNQLNVTPEAIQLNIYTAGQGGAGYSNNGELLYNNLNIIDGVPNTSYANGNLSLGNVDNVRISGGTNGYVLQTDGAGNLTWTAQTGGSGNGVPGGANTQIQYNDSGAFGGNSGFTFNEVSGNVNMPANLIVAGTVFGNVNAAIYANYANFAGNAFSVDGANVVGTVANASYALNANYAAFAGDVVNSIQSNITTLGTLTGLTVTGMTSIQEAKEKVTANASPSTGTVNFDVLDQAILFKTANASNNFAINIRGNSTTTFNSIISNNESITITLINTNGANGFYANSIQIDGNVQTPVYPLPLNPNEGTSNGRDMYSFNIIKTNTNTYAVFGNKIGFR
jgi:hypothetical protein